MNDNFHWTSSLKTKLGGSTLLLLVLSVWLVASNMFVFNGLEQTIKSITYTGSNRTGYPILYAVSRLSLEPSSTTRAKADLRRLIGETETWLGTVDRTASDNSESRLAFMDNLEKRRQLWEDQVKPALERIIAAPPGADLSAEKLRIEATLRDFAQLVDDGLVLQAEWQSEGLAAQRSALLVFSLVVLALLLAVFWVSTQVVRRTGALVATVEKVKNGDLDQRVRVEGRDELSRLGVEFNDMTARLATLLDTERRSREQLEKLFSAVTETTNSLSSASAEILAGTTQQATGMREQSSAVAETVTTVDEVLQTAEQAAERANAVSESSQHAADVSSAGRKAIEDTVQSITKVQEQSASIAEEILRLAEHGQEIGEIIAAVTDIADQTNLLAVNASIEASRAGEHGSGFTVVAQEIKELADQSKKATTQVRQILGEIQKATHAAVMAAEAGTRSVDDALKTVSDGGATIKILEETIVDAARAASQIAASAAQQTTGMAQIQQAMTHINEASRQNLAATRQTEQAAQDLNALGSRLKELLDGHER